MALISPRDSAIRILPMVSMIPSIFDIIDSRDKDVRSFIDNKDMIFRNFQSNIPTKLKPYAKQF
jgi:hypothetical protein